MAAFMDNFSNLLAPLGFSEDKNPDWQPSRRYVLKPGHQWNPLKEYPRNLPCPCGSNKKFKKCHMHLTGHVCTDEQAEKLLPFVKKAKEIYASTK